MNPAILRATEEIKALRSQPGFNEASFASWDLTSFADRFAISTQEASEILRSTRPAANSSRFEWLESVNAACGRGEISQKGLIVAVVLFSHFNDRSPYCWPPQQTIAKKAGWGGVRAVSYGLSQLCKIGAIERILARDLPTEVATKVLARKSAGGSGRDIRSISYKRVDPQHWQSVDTRTECSYNNRNDPFYLNHKVQPKPADISSNHGALTFNVESIDTCISRTDSGDYTIGDQA